MSADPKPGWQTTQPAPDDAPAKFSRRANFNHLSSYNESGHITQAEFDECFGNVLDRLDDIKVAQQDMPKHIATAMAAAMRDVLREPETAKALMANMRSAATEQAVNATGRGVLAVLKSIMQKWLLIALVLFMLAGVAGWGPALNAASAIFGPPDGTTK